MAQVCQITGKCPQTGHRVSHSNIKTKHRFNINLHEHRFWVPSLKRFIKLKVSAKGMRIIDKLGIEKALQKIEGKK